MYNRNNDSIVPWPLYPTADGVSQNPHQLSTPASLLSILDDVVTNADQKYFNVEVIPHHHGVVINNDNNDGITTTITNRITIAINGGFKPESTLTLKLSIPKTSTVPFTSQQQEDQSITLSTTISTGVKLRLQSGYTRNTISTLTSIIPTIDSTTSNEYTIISWKCDISDYAHPEFVFEGIILPTHTTSSTTSTNADNVNNNVQPNGDIYFAQLNEDNTINKSLSPLSIPIEFEYYNRGTPADGLYGSPPVPVTMKQHLFYQPIYSFIPNNIQCQIQFPQLPATPEPTDYIAIATISLESTLFNKPSTEKLTTYDSNSFWKTTPSPIINKIYPNSIITITYSNSSFCISLLTRSSSFEFINYPKSTTENDWSIAINTNQKTISITYTGTDIINISEDDNAYNINEWFELEFQYSTTIDFISIQLSISMPSTTQSVPSILSSNVYSNTNENNYQGGIFSIEKMNPTNDEQHKLYLLSNKLEDESIPSISSPFITIAGQTQFNLTLSNPIQQISGFTTVKLINSMSYFL